jgi:DNA repair protein RecO (recombination protein O)
MIVTTEAVVLKSRRYRETSKLVTVYSKKFGKVSGIAKGARETKSKFGAALEPMTHVSLVLYKKEHRDLHLISQSEIVKPFTRLHADLSKITVGLSVVELLDAAMHDEEPNEKVFRLTIDILSELDSATKNLQSLLYFFKLHFLELMGVKPELDACVRCRKKLIAGTSDQMHVQFDAQAGGIVCRACALRFPRRVKLSFGSVRSIQNLQRAALSDVANLKIEESFRKEIEEIVGSYIRHHLTGADRLKTEGVSKKLAV